MNAIAPVLAILLLPALALHAQESPEPSTSQPEHILVRPDPSVPPPTIPSRLAGELSDTPPPPPPPPPPKIVIPEENTLTSEIHNLGDHTVTVQEVSPVELPPKPTPAPPTAVFDPAKSTALKNLAASRPKREIVMFSATVHDGRTTHLRWQGSDPSRAFEAWSNINFNYLRGLGSIRLPDREVCMLYMGIGGVDNAKAAARAARMGRPYVAPQIPELPAIPEADPAFVITKGEPTADELAGLTALHAIYKTEHARLKAAYEYVRVVNEQREAELRANPPKPQNLIIKHWNSTGHTALPAATAPTATPTQKGESR